LGRLALEGNDKDFEAKERAATTISDKEIEAATKKSEAEQQAAEKLLNSKTDSITNYQAEKKDIENQIKQNELDS
jgi:hypothetical protein